MKKYDKVINIFSYNHKNHSYFNDYYNYFKDLEFELSEKVDGTNIRIVWDGYSISFLGRTEKSEIPPHLLKYLNEKFNTKEMELRFEEIFSDKEVVIYGEGYGFKIQDNGYFKDEKVSFIAFDIAVNERYLDTKDFVEVANRLGFERVPILKTAKLKEAFEYVIGGPLSVVSEYEDFVMEGVVAKPLIPLYDKDGKRIAFKVRYCDICKMEV